MYKGKKLSKFSNYKITFFFFYFLKLEDFSEGVRIWFKREVIIHCLVKTTSMDRG